MKVMVACEFSGIVRDAFISAGYTAVSCDLLPSESDKGEHILADITSVDLSQYDLLIAHPPCTYLCRSGIQWVTKRHKEQEQQDAINFVRYLLEAPVKYICLENPIGIISTQIRKPDQIIQPWQFGIHETKATCLWLKGLPLLQSTEVVYGRHPKVHYAQPGPERWKVRSRTCEGIAQAMAAQWGKFIQDALAIL